MISNLDYQPLTFDAITAQEAQLANLLAARQMQFEIPLNGQGCIISVERTTSSPLPDYQLDMELGGQKFRIFIGKSLLDYLLPEKLNHKIIKKLPKDLLKAAIDYSFSTFREVLQHRSGLSLVLSSFGLTKQKRVPALEAALTTDNLKTVVHIEINDVLTQLLTSIPPQQTADLPDIPFRVQLQKGQAVLTLDEVRRLEAGDLVFLEQQVGRDELFVRVNKIVVYLGSIGDGRVTILQRVATMEEHATDDGFDQPPEGMEDHHNRPEPTEDELPEDTGVDLNDLPVNLTFDVGEQQLTAAEILGLKTGFIFPLENPLQHPLKIRANGKLIGKGELVEVEGRLAARITELTS